MDIFIVSVAAICAAVLAALIKKTNKEYAVLLTAAAAILILLLVLEKCIPLFDQLKALSETSLIKDGVLSVLFKAVGVTIIGQVTANICKDTGESALAYVVDLATKVAVLLISLPVILQIFDALAEILAA